MAQADPPDAYPLPPGRETVTPGRARSSGTNANSASGGPGGAQRRSPDLPLARPARYGPHSPPGAHDPAADHDNRQPRLLDQLRHELRLRHDSIRTEAAYVDWARRYILFHGKRHPCGMAADEVAAFLTHLAVGRQVAPATQNRARSALLFLYGVVLGVDLPWLDEVVSAKDRRRLPVVLTPREVRLVLNEMSGSAGLVTALL